MRNGYDRPGPLLLLMAGILVASLQEHLRVAWALVGTVALLIAYVVHIAMRPGFYLTEAGDFYLTETGDRLVLE